MSTELRHSPLPSKKLSKNQQQLNGLTQRVESLKEEITTEAEKLEMLISMYGSEISPLHLRIAESRYAVAKALARASERLSFQRREREAIARTIIELCKEAFDRLDPNAEMVEFYNSWARQSYNEEQNELLYKAKEMFADMMRERYDIDIDVEDIEDSTEGFAQFRDRIRQQQNRQREDFWSQHSTKSRRQKAKEEVLLAKEELKQKGIRSVYIALAKVLHPDNETDPTLKAGKEELMKRVTAAYEQHDLQTLLKLEMEWVHNTTSNIEQLADGKIKLFIAVLRKQVAELEAQKLEMIHSPQYAQVAIYANLPYKIAVSRIVSDKRALKQYNSDLNGVISALRAPNAKKYLLDFVDYYTDRIASKEQDDRFWEL